MLCVKFILVNGNQYLVALYFTRCITNIKMQFEGLISTCCFTLNVQHNAQYLSSNTSRDNCVCLHVITCYKDKHFI